MSQTIDDFKDFYAPNKEREEFSLANESREVLGIMSYTLKQEDIEVELNVIEDSKILNYKNEYKQVLLNLLSNAKDALVLKSILLPKITITIENRGVTVSDNAGGVEPKIIQKIFEPYFTTKDEHSGIGLYMSKMIVEKNMGGEISLLNGKEGAEFKIIFK
jgi:signal transduction histidine kinase